MAKLVLSASGYSSFFHMKQVTVCSYKSVFISLHHSQPLGILGVSFSWL